MSEVKKPSNYKVYVLDPNKAKNDILAEEKKTVGHVIAFLKASENGYKALHPTVRKYIDLIKKNKDGEYQKCTDGITKNKKTGNMNGFALQQYVYRVYIKPTLK